MKRSKRSGSLISVRDVLWGLAGGITCLLGALSIALVALSITQSGGNMDPLTTTAIWLPIGIILIFTGGKVFLDKTGW